MPQILAEISPAAGSRTELYSLLKRKKCSELLQRSFGARHYYLGTRGKAAEEEILYLKVWK